MIKPVGLYLHIPFCVRKCAYCDFPSYAGKEWLMEAYVDRMLKESSARRGDYVVRTAYIGGGTPSTLKPTLMRNLLEAVRRDYAFSPDAEFTCEVNPGAVSEEFLSTLLACGVNRLSMGAQAAQDRLLSLLGRVHVWRDVEKTFDMARRVGFDNISLDLMLGLPSQTLRDVSDTLDKALSLDPKHISCYGLIVEDGTPLKRMVDDGAWTLPEEDAERDMYEMARLTLTAHGYAQYEISNFARPGYRCRHNVDCWRRCEYIGLGAAACGFLGDMRYRNPSSIEDYLAFASPEITRLSPKDRLFESVMLGLRMTEGVREADFLAMHGVSLSEAFGEAAKAPIEQGLLTWREGVMCLTRRGMDMQNAVLLHFL